MTFNQGPFGAGIRITVEQLRAGAIMRSLLAVVKARFKAGLWDQWMPVLDEGRLKHVRMVYLGDGYWALRLPLDSEERLSNHSDEPLTDLISRVNAGGDAPAIGGRP
jgi:hypothetical protein